MLIQINAAQQHTILAALRCYEDHRQDNIIYEALAADDGNVAILTNDQVEDLCHHLSAAHVTFNDCLKVFSSKDPISQAYIDQYTCLPSGEQGELGEFPIVTIEEDGASVLNWKFISSYEAGICDECGSPGSNDDGLCDACSEMEEAA